MYRSTKISCSFVLYLYIFLYLLGHVLSNRAGQWGHLYLCCTSLCIRVCACVCVSVCMRVCACVYRCADDVDYFRELPHSRREAAFSGNSTHQCGKLTIKDDYHHTGWQSKQVDGHASPKTRDFACVEMSRQRNMSFVFALAWPSLVPVLMR